MLFGDPESGKTLVLFDLLFCIAAGKPWRGRKVKQGAVFYLCGEGAAGLGRRAAAWKIHNKVAMDTELPFYTSEVPAALLDSDSAKSVMEAIQEMSDELGVVPTVVGVDTLARNFGGGDENSAKDVGQFVAHIDEYLIKPLGAAVITSHDTGHGTKDRARGSMSLPGALDVFYQITKEDFGKYTEITMECKKSKDFKKPDPMRIDLKVVKLGYQDEDGDEVTGATVHHDREKKGERKRPEVTGKYQTAVFDVLVNFYEQKRKNLDYAGKYNEAPKIPIDEVKREAMARIGTGRFGPGSDDYDRCRTQVNRAMNVLRDKKLIKTRLDGIHIYPAYKE
jgi:hypothetical protein